VRKERNRKEVKGDNNNNGAGGERRVRICGWDVPLLLA
jgi:hypothetical protein